MESSKQKIILISSAFPYRGGIAATTDRLAQEYLSRGENIEIWTYKMLYPKLIFPGKTQYLDEGHEAPKGLVIRRKISSLNPFNWIKIGIQLKKEKPKKIIIRYWIPFLAPCLGTIARIAKTPEITITCLVDNVIPHEKRFGDKLLSRYFFKKLDGFVVMAKQGKNQLISTFKIKTKIIYSPHPIFDIYGERVTKKIACQHLNLDPNFNYILSFGLIRKYKGVDLLIKAFGSMKSTYPNYKLLIVGECYDNWNDYEAIINQLSLENHVIRVDHFIANNEIKYYFSASDFLALTYRTATQSGVTQISFSMDTPMLVTNVGDLPNMVTHDLAGRVCENNVQSITDALHEMIKTDNLSRYRIGIIKEKERFGWNVMCDNIDKL